MIRGKVLYKISTSSVQTGTHTEKLITYIHNNFGDFKKQIHKKDSYIAKQTLCNMSSVELNHKIIRRKKKKNRKFPPRHEIKIKTLSIENKTKNREAEIQNESAKHGFTNKEG